jgi:glycosyltransferase involved in cell wall biosynthesis
LAGENVEFTGWLSDEELHERYRRASVYVQASRHEGFGLAVAEAMLAGCVPVVTNVTAMPEVVGDAGVTISSQKPEEVAEGVRRALELVPDGGRRARERVLTEFPLERRRDALLRVVEEALAAG